MIVIFNIMVKPMTRKIAVQVAEHTNTAVNDIRPRAPSIFLRSELSILV